MNGPGVRMTQRDKPPSDSEIADWIGKAAHKHWKKVMGLIDQEYPGVFIPEWLFGGAKHGWSLRYKKGRSFCTMVPEKGRFALMIVFGAQERSKVEAIRESLSQNTRDEYDRAATYHDGKWLLLTIDGNRAVEDAMRLLSVKRKPKRTGS